MEKKVSQGNAEIKLQWKMIKFYDFVAVEGEYKIIVQGGHGHNAFWRWMIIKNDTKEMVAHCSHYSPTYNELGAKIQAQKIFNNLYHFKIKKP